MENEAAITVKELAEYALHLAVKNEKALKRLSLSVLALSISGYLAANEIKKLKKRIQALEERMK